MGNFIQEASKELDHVVWPTQKETKKYFQVVVWVIVGTAIFLTTVGLLLREWLHIARTQTAPAIQQTSDDTINVEELRQQLEAEKAATASTGTTLTVTTGSTK